MYTYVCEHSVVENRRFASRRTRCLQACNSCYQMPYRSSQERYLDKNDTRGLELLATIHCTCLATHCLSEARVEIVRATELPKGVRSA